MSTLIVLGGLPATGKSTIASAVARRTGAVYLRVDRIEQAVVEWTALDHPVGPVGYAIAHEIAREQLMLGLDVIVECVNPAAATRDPWLDTAAGAGASIVEVELRCSDRAEHERRVATRASDVAGLVKPTWSQIRWPGLRTMDAATTGDRHGDRLRRPTPCSWSSTQLVSKRQKKLPKKKSNR